jgi:hypothetical protein
MGSSVLGVDRGAKVLDLQQSLKEGAIALEPDP